MINQKRDTYGDEVSGPNGAEDLIDGCVGGECAVEDVEVPLEALGDVVPSPPGVDHRPHHLNVDEVRELSGFLQVVEPSSLHHLTRYLIRHLNTTMIC